MAEWEGLVNGPSRLGEAYFEQWTAGGRCDDDDDFIIGTLVLKKTTLFQFNL